MKNLSLTIKLSLLFAALLAVVSVVDVLTVTNASRRYINEVMQRANLDLATSIAREIHIDTLTGKVSDVGMNDLFMASMTINPTIKLFIVDLDGKILVSSAKPEDTKLTEVSAAQIQKLLAGKEKLPIYNADPRNPDDPKIFSAAPLSQPDGSPVAYLYVTIGTHDQADLSSVKRSYILSALLRSLLIAAGVVLVVGLLLIFVLTRNVRKLSDGVQRLREGDLTTRVHIGTNDEIGQLGTAFNEMAQQIETSVETLSRNDTLRRELVANISHDLRTPLASIEGYTETILLKEHLLSDEERKTYLKTILKNTKSLGRLVTDLFELSKLEARQTEIHIEPFSITELIQDNLLKFEPQAVQKQIHLTADLPRDVPLVKADVALIERVLQNFISNAIQYTPQEGRVNVSVYQSNVGYVHVRVADTGRGITADELPYVFDRFYRIGSVREKSRLGLGLAIAQKIVELHGSHIAIDSTPDIGTTFSFDLPAYQ